MNIMDVIAGFLLSLSQAKDQGFGSGRVESRRCVDDNYA